jgi:hypothetical protein
MDFLLVSLMIAFLTTLIFLAWFIKRVVPQRIFDWVDRVTGNAALWILSLSLKIAAGVIIWMLLPHWIFGILLGMGAAWILWKLSLAFQGGED